MPGKGCINSASATFSFFVMVQFSTFCPARPNLEKLSPGAVFIWHDKSAEGIEHTNRGKNIRQILAEQSCESTRAALIFGKVIEKGRS
jgi:hypothetical protein